MQLSVNKKDQCRKEILQSKPKSSLQKLGKMVMYELKQCTKIKNLFGLKSFLISAEIETAPTFLEVQALQWETYSNYNFLKKALGKMQVVNDSAERAILPKSTTNPNERSHLYEVLPMQRRKFPDKWKSTLLKTNLVDDIT